jgi:hypothetical protein
MSKATLTLKSTASFSKPDDRDWTRELWRLAYRQSRSMIRDGSRYGYGARYVWALDHMRRRFGASGWPVCQQAARVAFDLRAVSKAATGTREQLAREGMLTRAVRVEPAPRGGWSWAWTFDELGSPNTARSLRRLRAKRLREQRAEDAARRRLVAAAMAGDRRDLETGRFYALTVVGVLALRAAEAARAHP